MKPSETGDFVNAMLVGIKLLKDRTDAPLNVNRRLIIFTDASADCFSEDDIDTMSDSSGSLNIKFEIM